MPSLNPCEWEFWDKYAKATGLRDKVPRTVRASMPGDSAIADELVSHYLSGAKTAGSGLVRDYEASGDALPAVGDYWIILDSGGNPRCVAKTLRVVFNSFNKVPKEVASAEADGSLEGWRKAHSDFFSPFLERLGIPDLELAIVVTEFYEVWKG